MPNGTSKGGNACGLALCSPVRTLAIKVFIASRKKRGGGDKREEGGRTQCDGAICSCISPLSTLYLSHSAENTPSAETTPSAESTPRAESSSAETIPSAETTKIEDLCRTLLPSDLLLGRRGRCWQQHRFIRPRRPPRRDRLQLQWRPKTIQRSSRGGGDNTIDGSESNQQSTNNTK